MFRSMLRTTAVALLIALSGCAIGAGGSDTGEYFDDAWITARSKAALVGTEGVSAMRIGVETSQGIVQLTGFSTSQNEINEAVRAVQQVKGVRAVRNDIRLRGEPLR